MQISTEARLNAIIEGTRAGTWEMNLDTGELILNDLWFSMLGYERSELEPVTEDTWVSLCHEADLALAWTLLKRYLNHESVHFDSTIRMRHKQGHWCWINSRGKMMIAEDGSSSRWLVGTHLDVTTERESQRYLTHLAETLPGIIYSWAMTPDGDFYFTYASNRTLDYYGVPPEQVLDNPHCVFDLILAEDVPAVWESIDRSYRTLEEWRCEYRVTVNDVVSWMEGRARPEREPDGTVVWNGMVVNIDERKRLELELERLSVTDELTGLYNRRFMLSRLEEMVGRYQRYGASFSFVFLDLDHFKNINDERGHLVGDRVLQEFAVLLERRLRKTDYATRTGGEEFLILMPDSDRESAQTLAEALRGELAQVCFLDDQDRPFSVTMSAGVVEMSGQYESVNDLLARCDYLLYRAKNGGRNRIVADTTG